MPDSAETEPAPGHGVPDGTETFDPAAHLDADGQPVDNTAYYLELACTCGAVRKQYDPAAYLVNAVKVWQDQHSGPGHGPASLADAVTEREARREASYRAVGKADEYLPSDAVSVEHPTEVTTWPDLAAAGSAENAQEG